MEWHCCGNGKPSFWSFLMLKIHKTLSESKSAVKLVNENPSNFCAILSDILWMDWKSRWEMFTTSVAAAAKSLQSCPTRCDPIDGSPPGSPVPGILQARTLEWVAISFSNACKWKVKVKSFSRVRLQRPHGVQPTRLLRPWDFPGKSTGVGCHCLLLKAALLWLIQTSWVYSGPA